MKPAKMIGHEAASPEALNRMASLGGDWYAYQNHDLGHPDIGMLRFLKAGPGCTFEEPPKQYPDSEFGIGWRYQYVGRVDMATGHVID